MRHSAERPQANSGRCRSNGARPRTQRGEDAPCTSDAQTRVIEKSGAYYTWKGDRIAQGRENACQWMQENPKAAQEIRETLVERRKAENAAPSTGSSSTAAPSAVAA